MTILQKADMLCYIHVDSWGSSVQTPAWVNDAVYTSSKAY